MAFTPLKTDYKDMTWNGLKKYTQIDNNDGTLSFRDDTVYTDKEKSFFGAKDANQMNEALNYIMTKLENGTDLYSEFQEFFRSQKKRFLSSGQATLEELKQAAKMDRDTFEQFIKDLKNQSVARMEIYENQQKAVFELWFKEIKATLSGDVAGNLTTKITALEDKIKTKIDQISTTDEAFINTLLNNTGKAGQDYLFGSKGDKNGIISQSLGATLYQSLNNCVHYSGYQIDVVNLRGQNEGLRDAHFKEPAYYLATFVEVKKVAIRILTTPIEVINDLIDSSTERALSAAQGKWLNENKLGKNDKAADSDKLDGHDSTYFATATAVQTAQETATQGVNAAAAAHGQANEAFTRAEQAFQSASNGKIIIANAITGKGVPTSTTGSWLEMARNIGKIKTPKVLFNELVNRMKFYTTGDAYVRQTISASILESEATSYYDGSGGGKKLGKKIEVVVGSVNNYNQYLLVIDLGEFNISSYSQISIPSIAQSSGIPFISKNSLFNQDTFTKEQFNSVAALKPTPQSNYKYELVRQGIDAFAIKDTYYASTQDIIEYHHMGHGHWFLVATIQLNYGIKIKNAIVLQ